MSTDLRAVLQDEVERLLPTHTADMSSTEWEPLTRPEPCELCGTRVVLVEWHGQRRWCQVTARNLRERIFQPPGGGPQKTQLLPHTPKRCSAAREALAEPTQLDLLTGEPA
ncbi:MAG: hypothetical protein AVDCRST_MAG68-5140 [uncultured Gemmatimonadetes bacterium]|uniref:Uncharacterized protein n=1 Tax=uncultured Gemmatimonadota bacterium TaxID=203437 RepID=A0A6J4MP93_9BACT|nr:MAG: hypothetical protein AVDCRST_MAG68-5140 [uncultured Gemmatimonadota bacterium]